MNGIVIASLGQVKKNRTALEAAGFTAKLTQPETEMTNSMSSCLVFRCASDEDIEKAIRILDGFGIPPLYKGENGFEELCERIEDNS